MKRAFNEHAPNNTSKIFRINPLFAEDRRLVQARGDEAVVVVVEKDEAPKEVESSHASDSNTSEAATLLGEDEAPKEVESSHTSDSNTSEPATFLDDQLSKVINMLPCSLKLHV